MSILLTFFLQSSYAADRMLPVVAVAAGVTTGIFLEQSVAHSVRENKVQQINALEQEMNTYWWFQKESTDYKNLEKKQKDLQTEDPGCCEKYFQFFFGFFGSHP